MKQYDHKKIEKKWQDRWKSEKAFVSVEDPKKEKLFVIDMFPYPSGEGLHVGHPKGYIATDVYSRHMRMKGTSVLHPMGWDAFGLPAENFALKHKVHPRVAVEKNIENFKSQLAHIGFDYDWSREINTTDPEYYKWTQWIFLELYKKGLAYQSNEPINWCPSCMTGLANEDLDGNVCERCGSVVEKRALPQWVLKITAYADRMLHDLDTLNWPEHIKEAQRNWIGRSEGAHITFKTTEGTQIVVFTTRPDTLFGATYVVVAPEHEQLSRFADASSNKEEVIVYAKKAQAKTEMERTAEGKEKTGVEIKGVKAINPANGEELPIFVADYVLGGYGTGAIMAVPAHDERDFAFAKKFDLPTDKRVITQYKKEEDGNYPTRINLEIPYTGFGELINSDQFTGLTSEEAKKKITEYVGGELTSTYKIKDWVFSRQRYWGEPIPIIHCVKDGAVPVPYEELPVRLPEVEKYEPSGTGESPLANIPEWVNTMCPVCSGPGKRETNTMPQWAGSSWYYLRFMDPHNTEALVGKDKEKYWAPVDVYVGGDHAVRHLIYARFWHKFLYDIGAVTTIEPFARLEFLGFILAEDGRKMSKRYGNVINPDDVVATYGADSFRIYEMFMGPFENTVAWSTASIVGTTRFVERVWRLQEKITAQDVVVLDPLLHQTIKKVSEDIEAFKFNTAVSQMMVFLNAVEKEGNIGASQWEQFLKILSPFAPHVTSELWELLGKTTLLSLEHWPEADAQKMLTESITIAVQINGKTRGTVSLSRTASREDALREASQNPDIQKWLPDGTLQDGQEGVKVIYVPGKILSFVFASS